MTEKRLRYMRAFLVGSSEFVIDDNATHERLKRYDILDKLNELNDENEQLKHDATVLIQANQDYRKENEQLKSELSEKDIQLDFLKDENKHMRDLVNENEQLKQREKTLEGMIRTFDEGCKEIYDDKCRLEEENEQLKQTNQRLNDELQECMGKLALKR